MIDPYNRMMGLAATIAVFLREKSAEKHEETGEVPPRNGRMTGPQSDNDETDTASCLPFASRSTAMGSAEIVNPEVTQMPRH